MSPTEIYIGTFLFGLVFGAGIAKSDLLRLKRDVNGLGKVTRRDRWNGMLAQMVILEKREDREQLARLLRE